ncbi:hypothetical protein T190_02000 [Sinorhizobium meliloti CCBAU 01290]|nr:hypothetical protein T190_02000 [Sinorhizobium meliloti CCBAU 01290]
MRDTFRHTDHNPEDLSRAQSAPRTVEKRADFLPYLAPVQARLVAEELRRAQVDAAWAEHQSRRD